ncbi:MAG: bifunctional proline dehydrogenase/L-glutamate gamma-semialdehyde dehydrogenase PutA [Methylomonas sp.]|jgi:RHH-type proline utilization regulon transcriptional repressor/proline dehydrogenase/delta 1-pyrroline-5-carboxylate dehydrogenase|uniref:bifunctional proline dehydrogenase/L-glutamate gamma-semialdehyde dehydrogenase PutA n=1 Tax=Methylomonas sp. TaxID=418 RepID=UPI0025E98B9F|nr:bifunctional proline dehydrogenase/L-glutamate gamma-semialdehyde dehydrogenase PutA [Methylomonas sp.]MCK9606638.1 bifunctional proline dehydrogenase/L-glutamate gamma-semialdehyde dehydrogenase PutA [Methylomonas sp.]
MNQPALSSLRNRINQAYLQPEALLVPELVQQLGDYGRQEAKDFAQGLISGVRGRHTQASPFEAFLQEYSLNSAEGIVLMSMAEAMLRIPDQATQNRFLQEKLADADWQSHALHSDSLLVNLASSALLLSGKVEQRIRLQALDHHQPLFAGLLSRLGEPLIRNAVKQAMQYLAQHFVLAERIDRALDLAAAQPGYRYSFDMLGEAALTTADAERYFHAYSQAIATLARVAGADLFANPGISIKLSALYPRYEALQAAHAVPAIGAKLLLLVKQARDANISVTIDAEEAERLEMSLTIFAELAQHPALAGWHGLGLAVQAYQKRAMAVIDWLAELANQQHRLIPVRLVKGAYWDTEIKRAQENGWSDYPVFTRKSATDVSYLACAKLILSRREVFYPQFATHNAHSVAAICQLGHNHPGFEFQRLHGMGQPLYDQLLETYPRLNCRVYAPVGSYKDLLPYLVRRLLENGANTSFIHQIENPAVSPEILCRDPVETLRQDEAPTIALPADLFAPQRQNSAGLNLTDLQLLQQWQTELAKLNGKTLQAAPLLGGQTYSGDTVTVCSPFDRTAVVGQVTCSSPQAIERALDQATQAFADWRLCPAQTRANYLVKAAELLEQQRLELAALCVREGGRTLSDALAEIREAVDLCRYYAAGAIELFGQPQQLPGPTGEENCLWQYGRGVFVCISPWNFPVAIFIGQIAAALAAGNTVIAKPALQTSLTGMACVRLLHQAGVPSEVLHFLPGEGPVLGKQLLSDNRVAGVAFTGSSATARKINLQLANRNSAIAALIAETGGQNVMLADNSAHAEQLVIDVLKSAFNSAGQRCSACRVLFLPEETADAIIERLIGAMQWLRLGSPLDLSTDVGPVIDQAALDKLTAHVAYLKSNAKLLYQLPIPAGLEKGHYFPPTLAEIASLSQLEQEVFGPILHVVRYAGSDLTGVIEAINASGYGLTLGVHSRIKAAMQTVRQQARVGNVYCNRNMIGAVVGVQPFGGMGQSGTGPKAGGPRYLLRFAVEQTVTSNLTAIGGNPWLLAKQQR